MRVNHAALHYSLEIRHLYDNIRRSLKVHGIFVKVLFIWLCDSAAGTATGSGLDGREIGVRVPVGERLFSSQRYRDRS
jgi:hypothetical protein